MKTAYQSHVARWGSCRDCPLWQQRTRVVLARGQVPADVVFVGEAPGLSEDALGQPFVGPAGKLLDEIIRRALGGKAVRAAYTNLVACFPREAKESGDHKPSNESIRRCSPRLEEFIGLCRPRAVVCVGALSTKWLHLAVDGSRDDLVVESIDHPAFLLRMPEAQRDLAVKRCIIRVKGVVEKVIALSPPSKEG